MAEECVLISRSRLDKLKKDEEKLAEKLSAEIQKEWELKNAEKEDKANEEMKKMEEEIEVDKKINSDNLSDSDFSIGDSEESAVYYDNSTILKGFNNDDELQSVRDVMNHLYDPSNKDIATFNKYTGEVIVGGKIIPKSNITTLLRSIVQKGNFKGAKGFNEFKRAIKKMGIVPSNVNMDDDDDDPNDDNEKKSDVENVNNINVPKMGVGVSKNRQKKIKKVKTPAEREAIDEEVKTTMKKIRNIVKMREVAVNTTNQIIYPDDMFDHWMECENL